MTNDREWYKARGICPRCRVNDAFENHVHCAACLEKITLNNQQTRIKNSADIYSHRYVERKREIRKKRKEAGLCPMCGKPAKVGKLCLEHHVKNERRNEKRRAGGRSVGEAFRERMRAGLCMYCEKPQVEGFKFCEDHLAKRQEIGKALGKRNGYARKEVDRQWAIAKLKHSESI